MKYLTIFDIYQFPWAGREANRVIKRFKQAGKLDELQSYIEEYFELHSDEDPDEGDINGLVATEVEEVFFPKDED